ncbi:heparinase II/III domain-containing protein [Paenibacillus roseipurpureus]|uniref:Heparinase II/III family protein n=1 Tax=Paenibacillus roseopurpureus TaxID=2918901 RepID=A0AA96LQ85_9BACL|nr:heparinase II/III family protein [Paenibacillus sp. MBLB1832]WNR45248.1 heparinase II/III family protein [Paenibacillus sp. MBLB1832]
MLEETNTDLNFSLFYEARNTQSWAKSMLNPNHAARWEMIRNQGEIYLRTPIEPLLYSEFISFGATGEKQPFEKKYFERRTRMALLALMYMADKENKWLRSLEDIIWAICDEFTWCIPAHVGLYVNEYPKGIWDQPEPPRDNVDLYAGETAFALAEIIRLLEHELSPWVVKRAKKEIDQRIFQVYFNEQAPQNWEMKTNNWPSVCSSSIGAAALYLVQDPARLAGMLWRLIQVFKQYLSGFDRDGATPEGIGYWQFGFGFFVYFAELLRERTGGQLQLLQDNHVKAITQFPYACMLSKGKVVNFSDTMESQDFSPGLFARLGLQLEQELYAVESKVTMPRCWVTISRDLLWSVPPAIDKGDYNVIPTGRYYFHDVQWLISKHSTMKGLTAFAAKGGHNGEPHNHNDLGHFILHVNGENDLTDLGPGYYTRQYFAPDERYLHYHTGSQGHSVPIIDGCYQGEGKDRAAELIRYEPSEGQTYLHLNLTKAYPYANLLRYERQFIWSSLSENNFQLRLIDQFKFQLPPKSLVEVFVSQKEPVLVADGVIQIGSVQLQYHASDWELFLDHQREKILAQTHVYKDIWLVMLSCRCCDKDIISEFIFTC